MYTHTYVRALAGSAAAFAHNAHALTRQGARRPRRPLYAASTHAWGKHGTRLAHTHALGSMARHDMSRDAHTAQRTAQANGNDGLPPATPQSPWHGKQEQHGRLVPGRQLPSGSSEKAVQQEQAGHGQSTHRYQRGSRAAMGDSQRFKPPHAAAPAGGGLRAVPPTPQPGTAHSAKQLAARSAAPAAGAPAGPPPPGTHPTQDCTCCV